MLSKFGTCKKCMFLTVTGLAGSLIAYGAAVFASVEMLGLPAMLAVTFFAAWSLMHLAGYVVNGKRAEQKCSSCNNGLTLTRRGFMGAAAWLLTSLGMKGVAARIVQPEVTKLEGLERVNAVRRALKARDVRNALTFIRSRGWTINEAMAKAALHKLKKGEMLAVGFPLSDESVLVYYEYPTGAKIKSEARIYVLRDEKTAKLKFISVNGGNARILTTCYHECQSSSDCGEFRLCYEYCCDVNWTSVLLCYVSCVGSCYAGPNSGCLFCLMVYCPICLNKDGCNEQGSMCIDYPNV